MPPGVIDRPFFRVRENLVGLRDLLEAFFGLFVPGVEVRVVFAGQPPVGLLDLFLAGVPGNSQDFVIIFHVLGGLFA